MRQDIYMHKGIADDTTPLSAESPTESNSAGSPNVSAQGAVMIGYAAMVGRQAYRVGIDELKASGNEELARQISNMTTFVTSAALVIGTGGKALIPMAVNTGVQLVGSHLERARENKETRIENRLRGRLLRGGLGD